MKKYHIYHPVKGMLNPGCSRNLYMFDIVAVIEAESLEDAFRRAQNDHSTSKYYEYKKRSTSVGDIISEDDNYYMVMSQGFEQVSKDVVSHVDWGALVKV